MSPYGTAGQVMYPGYLVRSRATHPSPGSNAALATAAPPPSRQPRLKTRAIFSTLFPSGELRRLGSRRGRRG